MSTMPSPTEEETVARLLEPLKQEPRPEWTPERQRAAWVAISEARPQRVQPWRLAVGGLAAAATAAAVLVIASEPTSTTSKSTRSPIATQRRVTNAATLPSGATVTVTGGAVEVVTASATHTELVLTSGSVHNDVPKLPPGGRYEVVTPQARVVVRGTSFQVSLNQDEGSTSVSVSHGLVEILPTGGGPSRLLRGGESFVVGGAQVAPPQLAWRDEIEALLSEADEAEGIARHNALVKVGRILDRNAPSEALEHWRRLRAEAPEGVHAEEAAWREVETLRGLDRHDEAAAAERTFRTDFPTSAYTIE